MKSRIAVLLIALLALAAAAQLRAAISIMPTPDTDEGIRGFGTITTPDGTVGYFSICVVRKGNILSGGLGYREMSSSSGSFVPSNYLYAREIKELEITGNTATVVAAGIFNGQDAKITFEGLDDNPCGDWIRITAEPSGLLPYIWSVEGGLTFGDIKIWQNPVPDAYAKGEGAIEIERNWIDSDSVRLGLFKFYAEPIGPSVITSRCGSLAYTDCCPNPVTDADRVCVRIFVPRFHSVVIDGFTAIMRGRGYIDRVSCYVEAIAVDTGYIDGEVMWPDRFSIKAYREDAAMPLYEATGPVVKGDIIVWPG